MGKPYAAIGAQLQLGDGQATEAFTPVARLTSVPGPALTTDILDATAHDSPNNTEEVVVGIKRNGEIEVALQFDPADGTHDDATGLISLQQARELRNFRWVFPDAANTTWQLACYVVGVPPTAPVDGLLTATVRLKPSGVPNFSPA